MVQSRLAGSLPLWTGGVVVTVLLKTKAERAKLGRTFFESVRTLGRQTGEVNVLPVHLAALRNQLGVTSTSNNKGVDNVSNVVSVLMKKGEREEDRKQILK